jgi:hypothetical protein
MDKILSDISTAKNWLLIKENIGYLFITKILVAFDIIINSIGPSPNLITAKLDLSLVRYEPSNIVL